MIESLETRRHAAAIKGDAVEVARLDRLIERLDDQRRAYGRDARQRHVMQNGERVATE